MNMVCPVCGSEYLAWATRCRDCGVALVAPAEAPNPLDLPEEEQVVYELGEWSLDLQAAAAAAMAEAGIPHAFDGPDLVVHVDHEAAVDALLDDVEHGGDGTGTGTAGAGAEGTDATLVYELDGWNDATIGELGERLDEGGVPYRLEGSQLVVDPADEEAVDFLVAEVRHGAPIVDLRPTGGRLFDAEVDDAEFDDAEPDDAEPDDAEAGDEADDDGDEADDDGDRVGDDPDDDDLDASAGRPGGAVAGSAPPVAAADDGEVLGQLYLMAANLADDPDDAEAHVEVLDFSDSLDEDRPPFGVDPEFWERVLVVVDDLADAVAGPDLDDTDEGVPLPDTMVVDDHPTGALAGGGQYIPQRSGASVPAAEAPPAIDLAATKRLARQLRAMLQPYV